MLLVRGHRIQVSLTSGLCRGNTPRSSSGASWLFRPWNCARSCLSATGGESRQGGCVDAVTELPSEPTVACQVCRSRWNSSGERQPGLLVCECRPPQVYVTDRHGAVLMNHFSVNIPIHGRQRKRDGQKKNSLKVIHARDTDETGCKFGEMDTARCSGPSKADGPDQFGRVRAVL